MPVDVLIFMKLKHLK